MSGPSFSLSLCDQSSVWNDFVTGSPQGSVFCRTEFLRALSCQHDLWILKENGEIVAGAVLLHRNGVVLNAPFPFTLYQGVLYSNQSRDLPPHRRSKWILEKTAGLLEGLSGQYERLSFCLHPAHQDLRGFQWFHYHEPQLGQFRLELFYSGLIDLGAAPGFESYLATIRQTRRNSYRQAMAKGLTIEISRDVDLLADMHQRTFSRQGIVLREELNLLVRSIGAAALENNFGEMLICRTAAGEIASSTLFLHDRQCGYYLFGANDPVFSKTNSGTFLLLENIRRCYERGLKWVDVVGVNSPNRGDFKTSCNAAPVPYFIATWQGSKATQQEENH